MLQMREVNGFNFKMLRDRADSATIRVFSADQSTIIMKFWDRRGWRGLLRRYMRTSPSWREWRAMGVLSISGVPIAQPIARFAISPRSGRFSDVLVMEDLGSLQTAHESLKTALRESRLNHVDLLESNVIELTTAIVHAGVLDPDHSMVNMLCFSDGQVCRIDFELARIVSRATRQPRLYGQMIAKLVASFVFTVQPELARADAFVSKLLHRLKPPRRARLIAKAEIAKALDRQRLSKGIDSQIEMNW